jgi:hypothetical protein
MSSSHAIATNSRLESRLAQDDENLMLGAVISKWNIRATNEFDIAVYAR